ncbi:hypothetical protein CLU80_5917 [Pseudomonas sp. 29]|uniref:hypothetical protein n=1 Tax=Pseudomonas sp. 29 TaxID=2035197 RepID=UPI000C17FFE5|nr:hypothetical protein [Pseudomonas sp. 29]PIF53402.1 hypothetical protein CLU80_5917 [Pseudomonas sp. 29]
MNNQLSGFYAGSEESLLWLLDPLADADETPVLSRARNASSVLSSGDVVEGVNVKELAQEILQGCAAVMDEVSFDPAHFIRERIDETVLEIVIEDDVRKRIQHDSAVSVKYYELEAPKRSDSLQGEKKAVVWKEKAFTLAEICTDYHVRVLKGLYGVTIQWPSYYPQKLREVFNDADYQEDFKQYVKDNLRSPAVSAFGRLLKKTELNKLVVEFIKSGDRSLDDQVIAFEYLKGMIPPRLLNLHSDPDLNVDNAVFIGRSNLDRGLVFFLGEDSAAFEFPAGHDARGRFVENNQDFQKRLLKRVPLRDQQKPYVRDFKYRGAEFPVFVTRANYRELVFRSSSDIGQDLFDRQIARALADIDTLVSTEAERWTDFALEAAGYLLQCVAFAASLPYGGTAAFASAPIRMLIPFLLGLGASATDLIRAEISDDPSETERLRINAAIGLLAELAGPIAERLIGKTLSLALKRDVGRRVLQALKNSNRPSVFRRSATRLRQQLASTTGKEIPDAAKGLLVAGYLAELSGGPNVAQKLATETRVIRLSGPEKGFVYQGFVFRGDMRDPSLIFQKGFTQRAPIKHLDQINGLKGGYGGAHDALSPDGAGISTSAFYKKDGAGAFVYGGQKGGFTYFIDARQVEGFHLYANTELAFRPNSGLKTLPPLEINYGVDLPPGLILGAYDPAGNFIANPKAINRAIAASEINPLAGAGRDVGNKLRQPFADGELLSPVDFGNEALNAQEALVMAAQSASEGMRPATGKVDSSDISAFRERQNAKRDRLNARN